MGKIPTDKNKSKKVSGLPSQRQVLLCYFDIDNVEMYVKGELQIRLLTS